MDMKIEVVYVPVSDIDRSKAFYADKLGFHADIDQTLPDGRRFVQLTPPGSACSIALGNMNSEMAPGSLNFIMLVVPDIQALYDQLEPQGVDITKPEVQPWGATHSELKDPDGNHWTIQQKPDRPRQP